MLCGSGLNTEEKTEYGRTKEFCTNRQNDAKTIYNEALKYANTVNNNNEIKLTLYLNEKDQSLRVTVAGAFTTYKIEVEGIEYDPVTLTKDIDSAGITKINGITTCGDITVTVTANITKYTTKIATLKGSNASQEIIVTEPNPVTTSIEATKKITILPDVSLQKYITEINNVKLDDNSNRVDRLTYAGDDSSALKSPSKSNNSKTDFYKMSQASKIKSYDEVTYKIRVYNNRNFITNGIKITDLLPYYGDGTKANTTIKKISKSSGVDETNGVTNGNKIFEIPTLAKGESKDIDITIKFNNLEDFANTTIINTAILSVDNNQGNYRTIDRDFVYVEPQPRSKLRKIRKCSKWVSNNYSKWRASIETRI